MAHLATKLSRTIVILNEAVKEDTSHGNGVAGEVGVVVHAITDLETSRGIPVAGQEREDVVLRPSVSLVSIRPPSGNAGEYIPHHRDEP